MKLSLKDLFSRCDQNRSFLKKFFMENFIFGTVNLHFHRRIQN